MTSQNKVKTYNPFKGAEFDDCRISKLNSKYCKGEISAEEYMDELLNRQ